MEEKILIGKVYINFEADFSTILNTQLIYLICTGEKTLLSKIFPQESPDGNYRSTHILIKQLNWKFRLTLNLTHTHTQNLFEKVLLVFSTTARLHIPFLSLSLSSFRSSNLFSLNFHHHHHHWMWIQQQDDFVINAHSVRHTANRIEKKSKNN